MNKAHKHFISLSESNLQSLYQMMLLFHDQTMFICNSQMMPLWDSNGISVESQMIFLLHHQMLFLSDDQIMFICSMNSNDLSLTSNYPSYFLGFSAVWSVDINFVL
jgi:hypothetical protein